MNDEVQTAEVASADQNTAAAPVEGDSIAAADNTAPAENVSPADNVNGAKSTPSWVQPRIDQLTREKHEERRAREEAEKRARELQEQISRLNSQIGTSAPQNQPQGAPAFTPPAYQPPAYSQADIETRARQIAEEQVRQQRFNEACNKTYQAGKADLGAEFDAALANFNMLGGLQQHPQLVEAATAMQDGHKILAHLGQNLDEAVRIMNLPPIQMAIEMTNLSNKIKGAPRKGSSAPAPVSGINAGAPSSTPQPDKDGKFHGPDAQAKFRAWRKAGGGR
jgi:hypothetical protein